jgi:hypothetical protein
VGFPIRKSADQRLFAPPHGLSQRTTSFIASQRQGIHRIPLRHLIALIIDALLASDPRKISSPQPAPRFAILGRTAKCVVLKDHLLQTYPRAMRSAQPTLVARTQTFRRSLAQKARCDRTCFLFTMTDSNASRTLHPTLGRNEALLARNF